MTTPKAFATNLRNLLSLLIQSGIAIVINPVIERHLARVTRITWSSPYDTAGLMTGSTFATIDEYCAFIDSQMYSTVLYDGALLQISYDYQGNELVGHRLCYYPCPFDIDREMLQTDPIGEVIDLYRESSDTRINLRSPCRFDYDEKNAEEQHPAVHMHVVRSHCRWAVTAPLSLGHFTTFVFRHFYPEIWAVQPFIRKWPRDRGARRMTTREDESQLHISCGQ
jgi:hypothetical protein